MGGLLIFSGGDNLDAMSAEISALRSRLEGLERRQAGRAAKAKKPAASFLPSRTLS